MLTLNHPLICECPLCTAPLPPRPPSPLDLSLPVPTLSFEPSQLSSLPLQAADAFVPTTLAFLKHKTFFILSPAASTEPVITLPDPCKDVEKVAAPMNQSPPTQAPSVWQLDGLQFDPGWLGPRTDSSLFMEDHARHPSAVLQRIHAKTKQLSAFCVHVRAPPTSIRAYLDT